MRIVVTLAVTTALVSMAPLAEANATTTSPPASKKWRSDGRCGTRHLLPDGQAGQCDPTARGKGVGPCCINVGYCGDTKAHCLCAGCTDFRRTGE